MPSTNHEAEVASVRSQSQPSAFKPVAKKRSEAAESRKDTKILQPNLMGVTKSNDKKHVTESATPKGDQV